jgi:hypothetical protein
VTAPATHRPEEQRRQRRALAAGLAGLVVLGVVGVAASVVVLDGPCEGLLPPAFSAPAASADGAEVIRRVAPDVDGAAVAARVVQVGEELGLGPVRGATPGDADATALGLEEGAFLVADDAHVRLVDTGLRAVATGRQRPEATRFVPAGDEIGLVQGEARPLLARYDDTLTLRACRPLDAPARVLHLSSGTAVVGSGRGVEVVRLDGGSLWRRPEVLSSSSIDAAVTGLLAIVATPEELAAFDLRTGEEAWRTAVSQLPGPLTDAPLLLAGDDVVVVATTTAVVRLDGGDGRVLAVDQVAAAPTRALATDRDVVVVAGQEVLRLGEGPTTTARLPGAATGGLASRDGDVYVATVAGPAAVAPDGTVRAVDGLSVGTIAVSDGYTIVGIDVGDGLLAFYGPVGAS